ncbi:MAG: hypothetical protein JSS07_00035 [Proteobacteria bacterium]|nr:hypothetical protein [Pseudomonadota bacterium]
MQLLNPHSNRIEQNSSEEHACSLIQRDSTNDMKNNTENIFIKNENYYDDLMQVAILSNN